jgi:ABC-type multidrug transport system fused ATPase/permease subunit
MKNSYLFIKLYLYFNMLGFAFVAQTPWIQRGTIRDNILFGQSYSLERYK